MTDKIAEAIKRADCWIAIADGYVIGTVGLLIAGNVVAWSFIAINLLILRH